ncbi:MAG: MATE family efflux transporter [Caldimonas sp.]
MTGAALRQSAREIAILGWPLYIGQVAVLAFSTIDTVMVARHSALDLAALAVGAAAYISVFIGLAGIVMALGPIAGQLYGAGRLRECGRALHQAMWLALALSIGGCALLLFPQPFLRLAHATPEVAERVRGYTAGLALALPAALLFTAWRSFNIAVSRPKAVMALQLGALVLKLPLTALFVFGLALPTPLGELRVPALGAQGCGFATAIVIALQMALAWRLARRDPFYERFGLRDAIAKPQRARLVELLRLGVPMGLSMLIEVTGFTFMAFLISRIGATPVAGHQIAVNLVSLMYMLPLAIANAAGTLLAQRIGAGDRSGAHQLGWHGVGIGVLCGAVAGAAVYLLRAGIVHAYTNDPVIVAAALPLLAWVALFHLADATQTVAAFVLRAYRIVKLPLVINAVVLWGVGLVGGALLAFDVGGRSPPALLGAQGFWAAATFGLVVAAPALVWLLGAVLRQQAAEHPVAAPA